MRVPTLAARILRLGDSSFLCNPDVGLVICQLSPLEADENSLKIPSTLTEPTAIGCCMMLWKIHRKTYFKRRKQHCLFFLFLITLLSALMRCVLSVAWQSTTKCGELMLNNTTFSCYTNFTQSWKPTFDT